MLIRHLWVLYDAQGLEYLFAVHHGSLALFHSPLLWNV
jgi:hypothetical protein